MKITRWYQRLGAALLACGLLSPAAAQAVNIPLGDPSFEAYAVPTTGPTAGYAYAGLTSFNYRPTSPWISRPGAGNYQDGGPTGSNWLYNATYAEVVNINHKQRAAPRTGNQAMHGDGGHVSGQVVNAVFEAGRTYTFSVYAQGDADTKIISPVGSDARVFLHMYDATLLGNDIGSDGEDFEVVRESSLTYNEEEDNPLSPEFTYFPHDRFAPSEPIPPDGTSMTAGNFVNRDPNWTPAQSRAAWQKIAVTLKLYPGQAAVGHQIGVSFKLFADGAVDDAALSVEGHLGDLNGDLLMTPADWTVQRNNMHTDLSSFSLEERYQHGDLTGDGKNNYDDFVAFAKSYNTANGAGAFQIMSGVPEPASGALAAAAGIMLFAGVRRR
jgi:hypothetical protein